LIDLGWITITLHRSQLDSILLVFILVGGRFQYTFMPMTAMNSSYNSFCRKTSYALFFSLNCSSGPNEDIDDDDDDDEDDAALALVDEDMIRCQIINCVAALQVVQRRRGREKSITKYELTKRKVFSAAISIILDTEVGGDQADIDAILSAFPDASKMSDERSWLMMHFAIALNARNKISKDEAYTLLSEDPLAMHRSSSKNDDDNGDDEDDEIEKTLLGCKPAHILCMQKQPK
jgi:hypothetical protein